MVFSEKRDMETEGDGNLEDDKDDTDDNKKGNQVMGWKDGRLTKMMKRWRNLHPIRKSYAIRTGKRSAEKLTNSLKIWFPRMSRGTEGNWYPQEDMDREKRMHGIFRIRKMALMKVQKKKKVCGWILQNNQK